jgi:hypothetical protein
MSTEVSRSRRSISAVAASPSITGIRTVNSTTSGRSLAARADGYGAFLGFSDDFDLRVGELNGTDAGQDHRLVVGKDESGGRDALLLFFRDLR